MAEPVYDQLALALREFSSRFGETAFTDRRRLTSLLSDRMPEARREIRVVSSAIDERVFETLARARPEQLGMEMDRLAARLENAAGIRTDIALSTVRACAYGLGLAPLPSAQTPSRGGPPPPPPPPPPPMPSQEGSWVGVSQPITAPPPTYRPPPPPPVAAPHPVATPVHVPPPFTPSPFQQSLAPPKTGWTMPKVLAGGGIGLVVVLVGLYMLGRVEPDPVTPPAPSHTVTPPVTPPPVEQPARTTTPPPARQPQTPSNPPSTATTPIPPAPARANGYGDEFLNFGVQAQENVQNDVGTATPTSIPGARFVSTTELSDEMRKGTTFLLIDSLEDPHPQTIVRAISIPYAGRPGNLYDDNEASLKEALNRLTQGRTDYPLVFFCQGVRCWESYNAALRAIAAGYRNVLWYRGGIYAWTQAGLPTEHTR